SLMKSLGVDFIHHYPVDEKERQSNIFRLGVMSGIYWDMYGKDPIVLSQENPSEGNSIENIEINLRNLANNILPVIAKPSDLVSDVKRRLLSHPFPPIREASRLSFNGKEMENASTLQSCGVLNKSIVDLMY